MEVRARIQNSVRQSDSEEEEDEASEDGPQFSSPTESIDKLWDRLDECKLKLVDMFRRTDTDNSGVIDIEELSAVLEKLGVQVNEITLEKSFGMLAKDCDGHIEIDEFLERMFKIRQGHRLRHHRHGEKKGKTEEVKQEEKEKEENMVAATGVETEEEGEETEEEGNDDDNMEMPEPEPESAQPEGKAPPSPVRLFIRAPSLLPVQRRGHSLHRAYCHASALCMSMFTLSAVLQSCRSIGAAYVLRSGSSNSPSLKPQPMQR